MLLIEIICYVTIILAVPIFYGELLASYLFKNNKDRVYHVYLGISFSLGISLLFIISFVIHMLFPISEEYRKYIVIILLVILPISMILIRNKYYRCFIKYNHDHFWLLWGGVFFISWLASLFPYVYPGLIKAGLGDHIEYIAIAIFI